MTMVSDIRRSCLTASAVLLCVVQCWILLLQSEMKINIPGISAIDGSGHEAKDDTFTLVVVRCRNNVEWLQEVPLDWRMVIYDKCGKDTAVEYPMLAATARNKHLVHYRKALNAGAEECNGYLDYMLDYYDNLTDVNIFVHDDALRPYDIKHKADLKHTPFDTMEALVNVTQQFVTHDNPFLHFGLKEIRENWGKDPHYGLAMKILWPYFAKPKANQTDADGAAKRMDLRDPPKILTFKPGAHFAVRKELIRMRPKDTYWALLQQIQHSTGIFPSARNMCCAMERMWHIFFGENDILPKRAMASDLLNITRCIDCEDPEA